MKATSPLTRQVGPMKPKMRQIMKITQATSNLYDMNLKTTINRDGLSGLVFSSSDHKCSNLELYCYHCSYNLK